MRSSHKCFSQIEQLEHATNFRIGVEGAHEATSLPQSQFGVGKQLQRPGQQPTAAPARPQQASLNRLLNETPPADSQPAILLLVSLQPEPSLLAQIRIHRYLESRQSARSSQPCGTTKTTIRTVPSSAGIVKAAISRVLVSLSWCIMLQLRTYH